MSDRHARIQRVVARFRELRKHDDNAKSSVAALADQPVAAREPDAVAPADAPAAPARQLDDLRNEARYTRERYEIYQAKVYGARPTTLGRLRELELAADSAQRRLDQAEHADAALRTTAAGDHRGP